MNRRPYTSEETEAIRAACRTETPEVVAARFERGVTIVRKIAALGSRRVGRA